MYSKILEFHKTTYTILTRKGATLFFKMALEKDNLPEIVEDFLKHADILHKIVENATLGIAADIRKMLYDVSSRSSLS